MLGYRDSSNTNQKLPLSNNERVDKSKKCWNMENRRMKLLQEAFDYVFVKKKKNISK